MTIDAIAEDRKASFLAHCDEWLCDGYSSDVRFVTTVVDEEYSLFDAAIFLVPRPHSVDNTLALRAGVILAGQNQTADVPKHQLMELVEKALSGVVRAGGRDMHLPQQGTYQIQLGSMSDSTWFQPLTCQVIGAAPSAIIPDRAALDNMLRRSGPPFDGVDDLRNWLGVRLPASGLLGSITITISPPVDVLIDRSSFNGDDLRLTLSAHPGVNRSLVRLAVRGVPDKGLQGRLQIADRISWRETEEGLLEGTVEIALPEQTAAVSMLLVGSETVRRHWFLHPAKAPNYRFAAVQQFDSDLKMIRHGLFESGDSRRFEAAVSALLFVLGFSAALQLETNAPDIIVATPAGRIVLVECAIRIADVAAKIGKLVDRRGALQKALRTSNKAIDVTAALVCRLPRDQIAASTTDVQDMGILLATAEDLTQAMTRAQLSGDADQILAAALQRFVPRPVTSPGSAS